MASVHSRDGRDDGQAQTMVAVGVGPRGVSPVEPVEHVRQIVRIDAGTPIPDQHRTPLDVESAEESVGGESGTLGFFQHKQVHQIYYSEDRQKRAVPSNDRKNDRRRDNR